MPRPPSELTGHKTQINVRVPPYLKLEFNALGGALWLRDILKSSHYKRKTDETVSTATANPKTTD
jgi:hypothetical protein